MSLLGIIASKEEQFKVTSEISQNYKNFEKFFKTLKCKNFNGACVIEVYKNAYKEEEIYVGVIDNDNYLDLNIDSYKLI